MSRLHRSLMAAATLAALCLAPSTVKAEAPATAALSLAGQLAEAGRYASCATEALRSWWLDPTQPAELPLELATRCLLQDQQWPAAHRILRDPRFAVAVEESNHLRVRACLLDAIQTPAQTPLPQCTADVVSAPKLGYLAPMRLLWQGRWLDAARTAERLPAHPDTAPWAAEIRRWTKQARELPSPSPTGAAALSAVVPGAGRVYIGKWQDGLSSLVLVGLPAWFAVGGFERDGVQSARGWMLSTTATALYFGNVYGSYIGAEAVADKARREWQAQVRRGLQQWVVP
jgi:hypothetical protein